MSADFSMCGWLLFCDTYAPLMFTTVDDPPLSPPVPLAFSAPAKMIGRPGRKGRRQTHSAGLTTVREHQPRPLRIIGAHRDRSLEGTALRPGPERRQQLRKHPARVHVDGHRHARV